MEVRGWEMGMEMEKEKEPALVTAQGLVPVVPLQKHRMIAALLILLVRQIAVTS